MTQVRPAAWQTTLDKHVSELYKDVMSIRQSVLTDGALSVKMKTFTIRYGKPSNPAGNQQ
jgi:hypothetical protein